MKLGEKITKNFTWGECIRSQTATRLNIKNIPSKEHALNIERVCKNLLQPLRDSIGLPINISSFYRTKELSKIIGSSINSQHTKGEAVDFEIFGRSNYAIAHHIENNYDFDQLILEYFDQNDINSGWIHCSYVGSNNRNETLTISRNPDTGKKFCLRGLVLEPFNAKQLNKVAIF